MSLKTYRAGVIGLGMIGGADQVSGDALGQCVNHMDGTHVFAYQNNRRVDLVAGASRDLGRRERFEERTGAVTYDSWRNMIANEKLDIVSVATYTPYHAEITIACAEHGIPVIYCEKPVATTLLDAARMLEAQKNGLLVFNHQRRFNLNYRRLQTLISEGELGELTSAFLQWPTGRLGNVGTHAIDTLLMLSGQRIQAVSATLDLSGRPDSRGEGFRDPGGWGLMRMYDGLMVMVSATDYSMTPARTEINGTKGRATIDSREVILEYWEGDKESWLHASDDVSGMDRATSEIVAWLDDCVPFPYAPEEAVHTLEAIVAFHVSHSKNAVWIDLPLSGVDREIEVRSG